MKEIPKQIPAKTQKGEKTIHQLQFTIPKTLRKRKEMVRRCGEKQISNVLAFIAKRDSPNQFRSFRFEFIISLPENTFQNEQCLNFENTSIIRDFPKRNWRGSFSVLLARH